MHALLRDMAWLYSYTPAMQALLTHSLLIPDVYLIANISQREIQKKTTETIKPQLTSSTNCSSHN